MEAVDAVEEMHYGLGLVVTREADGLHLHISHDPELFPPAQVARLGSHWIQALASLRAAPDARARDLDILPADERHRLLVALNETPAVESIEKTLVEVFDEQCRETPEHLAMACGDVALTYRELGERAERVAAHLVTHYQVGPEIRVGLVTSRSEWLLVGLLGILKAGAAYVPIDPESPADRSRFIQDDAGVALLLTTTHEPCPAAGGDEVAPRLAYAAPRRGGRCARPSARRPRVRSPT